MLNLSRLLAESGSDSMDDSLRYSRESRHSSSGTGRNRGPVVVWNITRACNLSCRHCYAGEKSFPHPEEISTGEALKVIEDLAQLNVPVLLFSGGEPLMRDDLEKLIERARSLGIRVALSSNGTLLTEQLARRLEGLDLSYIGISIDGNAELHNDFRRDDSAFERSIEGLRRCREIGQKVGLRFTMVEENRRALSDIFRLMEREDIPRLCLYHLVPQGRGINFRDRMMAAEEKRALLDKIIERADDLADRSDKWQILTVANQADGVYLYLKLKESGDPRAERIYRYLARSGGNRSGQAIACIDWRGKVHPDQFSFSHNVGDLRKRSFIDIWRDSPVELLQKLRNREEYIEGRCSRCRWFEICGGSMRSRAEALKGSYWAADPGCYLKEEEITADSAEKIGRRSI